MSAGTDTVNKLKPELSAIAGTTDPGAAKPHVSQTIDLLQGAQSVISGGPADVSDNYNSLLEVFRKSLAALEGPNSTKALSDLQALSKHALDQIDKAS